MLHSELAALSFSAVNLSTSVQLILVILIDLDWKRDKLSHVGNLDEPSRLETYTVWAPSVDAKGGSAYVSPKLRNQILIVHRFPGTVYGDLTKANAVIVEEILGRFKSVDGQLSQGLERSNFFSTVPAVIVIFNPTVVAFPMKTLPAARHGSNLVIVFSAQTIKALVVHGGRRRYHCHSIVTSSYMCMLPSKTI